MNIKLFLASLLFITNLIYTSAQEKRTFTFNNIHLEYYLFSNMTTSFTKYPNHEAKFIIVNNQKNLLESSITNKIADTKIARKDNTLYYYFKLPNLENEKQYLKFLKEFINDNYSRDFFNRNTVSINFQDGEVPLSCESLDDLNMYFAKIIVSEKSSLFTCNKAFVIPEKSQGNTLITTIKYKSITIKASKQKREDYKVISQLTNWRSNYFITVTLGNHFIDNNYQTGFDEETLVDINEVNSIWQFGFGYMFTDKIGGLLNFGLMTSKEQSINTNGGSISGSGSGFGLIKLGAGVRYIPFSKKNWSIYGDICGGSLNVKAAGGSGGINIVSDITERTERSNYLCLALGTKYRLGGLVFLSSNFEHTISNFETNIGSISGFTGYTINLGIGVSFK